MASLRLALQLSAQLASTPQDATTASTDPSESQMSDSGSDIGAVAERGRKRARSDVDVATPAAGGDAKRGKVDKKAPSSSKKRKQAPDVGAATDKAADIPPAPASAASASASSGRAGRKAAALANSKLLEKSVARASNKTATPGSSKKTQKLPNVSDIVEVLWDDDDTWYRAAVTDFNVRMGKHQLRYDKTGETEWANLKASGEDAVTWRMVYQLPPVLPPKSRKAGRRSKKGNTPSMPADVEPKLKQHIELVWPNDGQWYSATVVNYSAELRKHGILYARGETEWVDLQRPGSWRPRSTDLRPEAHETKRDKGVETEKEKEKTEQQWVQCEHQHCGKWRKVPTHIDPESLPDKWTCSMNHWDPHYASCDAEQEPEDDEPEVEDRSSRTGATPVKKDSKLSYQKLNSSEAIQANLTYRAYHLQDEPYVQSSLYIDEKDETAKLPSSEEASMARTDEQDVVRSMMKRVHRVLQRNQKLSKPWRQRSGNGRSMHSGAVTADISAISSFDES